MSDLADLLAGRAGPGIFGWSSPADAADVRRVVEDAGWRFEYVDARAVTTKPELLDALGEALDFPGHYGRNFDALADCLHDVDAGGRLGTLLLWDGWEPLAHADPHAFSVALRVLRTRVRAKGGGPFAVLLRGEGPAPLGLPSLDGPGASDDALGG